MSYFTFTKILFAIAILYLAHSIYSFYHLFNLQSCYEENYCIYPNYNVDSEFELVIGGISEGTELSQLHVVKRMKLSVVFETKLRLKVSENKSYLLRMKLIPWIQKNGKEMLDRKNALKSSLEINKMHDGAGRHLMSEQSDNMKQEKKVMHFYNQISITSLVSQEDIVFHMHRIPQELIPIFHVHKDNGRMVYEPIVIFSQMMLSRNDLVPLGRDSTVNITLSWMPISLGKLRLWQMVDKSMDEMKKLGFTDKNIDSVKSIFTRTNLYLLILTFTVSLFHLLFDILSFKNDVSFWRNIQTQSGLSSRTIVWRCVSGCIILLYLLEEDTSLLILCPFIVGLLVEFWKLVRLVRMRNETDTEVALTNQYDQQGVVMLIWFLAPLCLGGAVYSLVYIPHKSWYSWCVHTMANGVYVFGFLFMTPQLFINYKLKSVAHLPWRALTYKAFNTFIDDVFAFIITMPTSHRLACFRDDIIFIIYLYQRWLYPVDKSRVNEFGKCYKEPLSSESPQPPPIESSISNNVSNTGDVNTIMSVEKKTN